MARIRTFCGKDLDSMADYVQRHLPRCPTCMTAHALQQRQRINISATESARGRPIPIHIARRIGG